MSISQGMDSVLRSLIEIMNRPAYDLVSKALVIAGDKRNGYYQEDKADSRKSTRLLLLMKFGNKYKGFKEYYAKFAKQLSK
ncbi:MAG: hypothetical protein IPJ22_13455 [Bacteroidetes bacterium]|nr:hypothetical protein [Bacteroidota bacterium]